jgi:adenylate kinase family enzyme
MEAILPRVEGICDDCGGALVTRPDDTEEIVIHRLEVYHQETEPLLDYFEQQGVLATWKVRAGIQDTPDLLKMAKKILIEERGKVL